MAVYHNFSELAGRETESRDYIISCRHTDSAIAVLAPHGGWIEPGTTGIADALAGDEHNYYSFTGIKRSANRDLHLTSNSFDEPRASATVARAMVAITIHGLHGGDSEVLIGGLNHRLQRTVQRALTAAGFSARISDISGLKGTNPTNICNRCTGGEGVQLEISRGLREQLFEDLAHNGDGYPTPLFTVFIAALRRAINSFQLLHGVKNVKLH